MSQEQYIYYTGVGANPNGIHTVQEFINIANAEFKMGCSKFLEDQHKPCIQYRKMDGEDARKRRLNNRTKARQRKYKKLVKECKNIKAKTKKRDCNIDEYIEFSGAEYK